MLSAVNFFVSLYSYRRMQSAVTVRRERRLAMARLVLGFLQIAGAGFSLGLLVKLGVTNLTLTSAAITGLLTTLSVLIFGGRKHRPAESREEGRR
jgi:hypothetical protein